MTNTKSTRLAHQSNGGHVTQTQIKCNEAQYIPIDKLLHGMESNEEQNLS